jgi:hypothetical protein
MRRLIVAAVVVILGVGAGLSVAASASSEEDHNLTFIQHDLNTAFTHQPPNPGDSVVVQSELLDSHQHKVGTFDGTCVVGFGHLICQGIAEFPGKGDITLAGEFVEPTGNGSPTGTVAITGGTGRYRGAKGEHHTTPIDDTHSRVTFFLENNG